MDYNIYKYCNTLLHIILSFQLQFVTCKQNCSNVTMNTNGIFANQNVNKRFSNFLF